MYAPRVHGEKKLRSLSSAKVQKFNQSDNSRSSVGVNFVLPRSVNGVGILLTRVNINALTPFYNSHSELLT